MGRSGWVVLLSGMRYFVRPAYTMRCDAESNACMYVCRLDVHAVLVALSCDALANDAQDADVERRGSDESHWGTHKV